MSTITHAVKTAALSLMIATPFYAASLPLTCAAPGGKMLDACETVPGLACPTPAECSQGWTSAAPASRIRSIPFRWIRFADGAVGLELCNHKAPSGGIWRGALCPSSLPVDISLREWCQRIRDLPVPPAIPGVVTRPPPLSGFGGLCGVQQ